MSKARGRKRKGGFASLKPSLITLLQKVNRSFREGRSPSFLFPPSLFKLLREGGQGDRFLKNYPLNPLPKRFSNYTTLSDDGSYIMGEGDVKGEGEGYGREASPP